MAIREFHDFEPVLPNDNEVELARNSSKVLSSFSLKKAKSVDITFEKSKKLTIPRSAFKLLISILAEMAEGNAVALIPVHAELTTQEAADLLNVSRPYLIQLLETKLIPFRKVGNRRKILLQDIISYKSKVDIARRKVLDELIEDAQRLDLGY